jgi:hypothetical protein
MARPRSEIQRVATQQVCGSLFAIEQIGGFSGKTVALANGAVHRRRSGLLRAAICLSTAK